MPSSPKIPGAFYSAPQPPISSPPRRPHTVLHTSNTHNHIDLTAAHTNGRNSPVQPPSAKRRRQQQHPISTSTAGSPITHNLISSPQSSSSTSTIGPSTSRPQSRPCPRPRPPSTTNTAAAAQHRSPPAVTSIWHLMNYPIPRGPCRNKKPQNASSSSATTSSSATSSLISSILPAASPWGLAGLVLGVGAGPGKCPCLRFMLNPLVASGSFLCDGCGCHACFHELDGPVAGDGGAAGGGEARTGTVGGWRELGLEEMEGGSWEEEGEHRGEVQEEEPGANSSGEMVPLGRKRRR